MNFSDLRMPGTVLTLQPDFFVLTDGTAKMVPSLLEGKALADAGKVKVFIDHETPCGSERHAEWQKQLIHFATDRGCSLYNGYGTSYQLMLEKEVKPGQVVAHCGDFGSIYGAADVLAVKLSPEELAEAMVSGEVQYTVPESVCLNLKGALQAPSCAKDAAIAALGHLGDTTGKLVFVSGLPALPNEAEAIAFFQLLSLSGCDAALPCGTGEAADVTLNLSEIVPMVAGPNDFHLTVPAYELSEIPVTSVFIGGCSAGRIEDIRTAVQTLKGRRVQRKVRTMLAFASTDVYVQAANEGLIAQLMDAGILVMNQGCSGCYAHSQGLCDDKDTLLSTGSRACPNCLGEGDIPTLLCSTATAIESAIAGYVRPAGT